MDDMKFNPKMYCLLQIFLGLANCNTDTKLISF